MNYYYSTDGTEVHGPCSLDELTNGFFNGSLPAATQVCAEGTETWQTLRSVVRPPPPQPIESTPVFEQTTSQPIPQTRPTETPASRAANKGCGIGCLGVIIAFLLWAINSFHNFSKKEEARAESLKTRARAIRSEGKEIQWKLDQAKRNHDDSALPGLNRQVDDYSRRVGDLLDEKNGKKKDDR